MTSSPTLESRFFGSVHGCAVGDALGTTLEFCKPGSFLPVTDIIGGGPFNQPPGNWTDDTSMALCMALSLLEKGEWNPYDCVERFLSWYNDGYLSGREKCFDIGITTRDAVIQFERTRNPYAGGTAKSMSGNGSIMRLFPIPLFFSKHPDQAIAFAADSSRLTHGSTIAMDCCRYMAAIIIGALQGRSKEELLSSRFAPVEGYFMDNLLAPEVDVVASGSFKVLQPPNIVGSGYSVKSLEAALWAFYRTQTFKDGLLMVVNLGNDSDSTGAIYGQIAGAYYGYESIPQSWIRKLTFRSLLHMVSSELYTSSQHISPVLTNTKTPSMIELTASEPITSIAMNEKVYRRNGGTSDGFKYFMERFLWMEGQWRVHLGITAKCYKNGMRLINERRVMREYEERFRVRVVRVHNGNENGIESKLAGRGAKIEKETEEESGGNGGCEDYGMGVLERLDVIAGFGKVDEELEFLLWNDFVDCFMKVR